MNGMEDLFRQQDMQHPLPEGFEERVFARIETRKRQRRVAVTTAAVSAVLGFVFALVLSLPRSSTQPLLQANNTTAVEERREVIPVMEDVVFSSSAGRTHYAVEQVSLEEEAEL